MANVLAPSHNSRDLLTSIREKYGFDYWKELAEKWGIPASTLRTWVGGDATFECVRTISEKEGMLLQWLVFHTGPQYETVTHDGLSEEISVLTGQLSDTLRLTLKALLTAITNNSTSRPPTPSTALKIKETIIDYLCAYISNVCPATTDAARHFSCTIITVNWVQDREPERFSVEELLSLLEVTDKNITFAIKN